MESDENWQLANQYSNSVMLKAGLGLMLIGVILSFFAFNQAVMGVLTGVSALAGGIVIFFFTEKQLK
ncbi:SdpI family protein [Chitinophaga pinensis]|uniref:SdpI family protein n=2 Tax=Chitinophaga pinensis TaxID=79329 RepID=A0A5C6LRN2_9BACT|nr:SdpI family protein [Chitinophaga pinensis]